VIDLVPSISQALILLFLLLPGFVFLWTFERMAGPVGARGTDRLVRAVAWSALIDALGSLWLYSFGLRIAGGDTPRPFVLWATSIVFVLVAPVVLGVLLGIGRRQGVSRRLTESLGRFAPLDPTPTAWDFALSGDEPRFVRVRLKDGTLVGGFFGSRSYASSYPEAQDIFIEKAWEIDGLGEFTEPIEGSAGIFVPGTSIETLDVVEIQ
jgi:hypothetical protein